MKISWQGSETSMAIPRMFMT